MRIAFKNKNEFLLNETNFFIPTFLAGVQCRDRLEQLVPLRLDCFLFVGSTVKKEIKMF